VVGGSMGKNNPDKRGESEGEEGAKKGREGRSEK